MSRRQRLPALSLVAGAVALSVTIPVVLSTGAPAKELPWIAGTAIFVAAAALTWRRRSDQPVTRWFAGAAGVVAIVQTLDGVVLRVGWGGDPIQLAWVVLAYHLSALLAVVLIAHLIGLFPDGRPRRRYERTVLRGMWSLLVLPALAFLGGPTLLTPSYHLLPDVPNPYHVELLTPVGTVAQMMVSIGQGLFAVGVVLLVLRYRRAGLAERRRIRWLLLPGLFVTAVAIVDLIVWRFVFAGEPGGVAELVVTALWIPAIASLPLSIAIGVLRPDVLDVDRVIRKSLVYGLLWAVIAAVYMAAATGLGLAAGRRLPVELAIAITVAATVAFQPARRRLERLADRWVFGVRADPARVVTRLGAALEETVETEQLLPRMAETLREGLGLRWARVRLEPAAGPITAADEDPVLAVPIVLGEERLGVVECGPKETGQITDEDTAVVTTFARQAALAVRNLRLAAELEGSRARLVRAQEAARRRLERNLHDGVQQDLVALMGHTAYLRAQLETDPATGARLAAELQEGLRRVMSELRELAHGIHPSVLSDRGLLEAVEALAARSAVPVSVRADPTLRGQRFAEEVEGAGYFTIAEALANVGKHAAADHAEVSLARMNGSLRIEVRDDGSGFDPATAGGDGLANLADRLTALGGRLEVASRPGGGTTVSALLRVADA